MKHILTTRDPYDSNYCTEDGQVLYRVACPYKFVNRRATIDKVVPGDCDGRANDFSRAACSHPNCILDMHDKSQRIAEIEFHTITPSTITCENTKHSTSSFFRKGSFALLGRYAPSAPHLISSSPSQTFQGTVSLRTAVVGNIGGHFRQPTQRRVQFSLPLAKIRPGPTSKLCVSAVFK